MFGRKIPDKVVKPPGSPDGTEGRQTGKRASADRGATHSRGEPTQRRMNSGGVETVLGEDTVFLGGKIVSKGTLRIDGYVEAEIQVEDSVVVGPNATVKANITARNVAISGKVFGNIVAHERLELQPTSEVYGDVQMAAGALIIEGGAKLEGKCVMGLTEKPPESASPVEPPEPVEVGVRTEAEGQL